MLWFKEPTLLERLERELREAEVARIHATAKVAMWKHDEKFRLAELGRLEAEIALLKEASAADEVALEVEAVAVAFAGYDLQSRTH